MSTLVPPGGHIYRKSEYRDAVLSAVARSEEHGVTWPDVVNLVGGHHGSASGTLSVLHKAGRVARLAERRGRCKVYVLPHLVGNRDIDSYSPRVRTCPHCGGAL